MKHIIIGWTVGTAVYVVLLLGSAALLGGLAQSTGAVPATWPILVVPPVIAGAAAAFARRAPERPAPTFGLTAALVPALTAAVLGLIAHAQAVQHADVPASAVVGLAVLPLLLVLATGAGVGLWRRSRWTEAAQVPAYGTVG